MVIKLQIIQSDYISKLPQEIKVKYILDRLKRHNIVILEKQLTPKEQAQLIKDTMKEINLNGFYGFEILSFNIGNNRKKLLKVISKKKDSPMIIVPSNLFKQLNKEEGILTLSIEKKG